MQWRKTSGMTLALLAAAIFSISAKAQDNEPAFSVDTTAPRAFLIEDRTGTVLLQKSPDETFPPASLAKLMTMEIVFEALNAGTITLETEYPVSEYAWRTGGAPSGTSTMFAALKSNIPVSALIRGTIVQAANDGAIILAEGLAGSEEAFAERMNERAEELGLTDSHFVNPTGLPAEGQHTSVGDLVTLTRHIREAHPELYKIYSEPSFEWNTIFQRNRNPILGADIGGEGVGTGFTENSGYSLMGVADRNGRTVFLALSGLSSAAERTSEALRLLDYAFNEVVEVDVFSSDALVGRVPVFNGADESVAVVIGDAVRALLPENALPAARARIRFEGPLIAPVEEGDRIGTVDLMVGDKVIYETDALAGGSVAVGSFTDRAKGAVEELAFGWTRAF